jgi:subtilase family serine protease
MTSTRRVRNLLIAVIGLSTSIAGAASRPALLSQATDLGQVNPTSTIEITLWMKLHDQQGLDNLVTAQQSGTAGYLSSEELRAQHAPTPAEVTRVADFMKAQGFTVNSVGQENLFIRASGTVARVQNAFQVELHQYNLHGRTFRASSRGATIPSALQPLVSGVGGLSDLRAEPQISRIVDRVGAPGVARQTDAEGLRPRPLSVAATPEGVLFSAQCFYPPTSVTFTDGTTTATYQGNRYGAPITNTAPGTRGPCGYQPSDIQTAYNLKPLYQFGLNGQGTTIAIVDAFGSTTIAKDAQAFSQAMGLPPVNLTIVGTPTESTFSTDANASWATETTLDVEWVHAIAPGAKILLVIAPTNQDSDLFAAIGKAAATPGVVAISNSWSGFEIGVAGDSEFYSSIDNFLKLVDASGIAVNFSTGDFGNNASQLGGLYTSIGWPASSPFATAVGGVSVALDAQKHIAWQTSWGTNITEIADTVALGSPPLDPPNNEGFSSGGTGGLSDIYPKPFWQREVPGERRGTPDISWVADPFTGVEIIFTGDAQGNLALEVIGGTSASCPMFTALWGIATQRAHHLLGQAAPRLYRLPRTAITDVPANPGSARNVTGTIQDAGGTSVINSWELAAPLQNLPKFISALYNSPFSTRWFVVTFGLDSTLPTGEGWDLATGLGTPNGWNFVQAVATGY